MDIAVREYIQQRIAEEDHGHSTRCWIWKLSLNAAGYGQGRPPGYSRTTLAHRFTYLEYAGPIPAGFHLDHLCRVRDCCNPAHLEPVTPEENARRANHVRQPKTHCKRGHELVGDNLLYDKRGGRRCKACFYQWQRDNSWRLRRERPFDPNSDRLLTHCKNGHEFTPENTIIWKNGGRRCRACNVAWRAANDDHRARFRRYREKLVAAPAIIALGGGSAGRASGDQQRMSLTHSEGLNNR
jgi:hypothetical protein